MDGVNLSGTNTNANNTEQGIAIGLSAYQGPLDVLVWLDAVTAAAYAPSLQAGFYFFTLNDNQDGYWLHYYSDSNSGDSNTAPVVSPDINLELDINEQATPVSSNVTEEDDAPENVTLYPSESTPSEQTPSEPIPSEPAPSSASGASADLPVSSQSEGGAGNDRIYGGSSGTNILYGGDGTDTLISAGGAGSHNTLIGGADNDTFVIAQQDRVIDIIKDFNPDDGDKIKFLIGNSANKNDIDKLLKDNYLNHKSTTIEDYKNDGTMDTVLTFDTNIFRTPNYQLILEGFTAPLLIDYVKVEVDA